jgi:hypothetical protein
MKAILIDESVKVFNEISEQQLSLATLQKGEEFELGKVLKKKKEVWVEVILPSGQTGYISGNTKIFAIRKVQLLNNSVDMVDAPADDAKIVKSYAKNAIFTAIGVEKDDKKNWVRVKDDAGDIGFIRGDAKIKVYQEPTKSGGKKLMITGGLFTGLGIAMYVYSVLSSQAGNNTSIFTVAIIALGCVQLFQGIMEYRKASKAGSEKK